VDVLAALCYSYWWRRGGMVPVMTWTALRAALPDGTCETLERIRRTASRLRLPDTLRLRACSRTRLGTRECVAVREGGRAAM